jgi:predicted small lipoprotein YifL
MEVGRALFFSLTRCGKEGAVGGPVRFITRFSRAACGRVGWEDCVF